MDYRGLFIWPLVIFCAQAAFIRRLPCGLEEDGSTDSLFEPLSLTGSLDSRDDGAALSIKLLGDFIDERCEELDGASAVLTLDARLLGRSGISGKPWAPEGRCPTLSPKDNPRYVAA